jgi:hypothetical protein
LESYEKSNSISHYQHCYRLPGKGRRLREKVDKDHSEAVAAKMQNIAQQWDDLAADYETSILKCVG